MKLNLNSNIDLVDQDPRYMDIIEAYDPNTFKERDSRLFQLPVILDQLQVLDGYVIEAGVWKGTLYSRFQKYFGKDRCIGFDIEKYIDDTSIIYGDFRITKDQHPYPCSLFMNGLGTWNHNRLSKTAGVDYANKNLVMGGYYLDTHYFFNPLIETTGNFEKVTVNNNDLFVIYKKVRNG